MSYCNKCGAYIPDGHTVCLACGYDDEAEKRQEKKEQKSSASAEESQSHYYSFTNEELKKKLEEQRRRQQEQSRKWAEAEKQRRENRQTEQKKKTAETVSKRERNTKLYSGLSYVSFLFILPMLFCENDRKAMFHSRQGLRLFIYSLISDAFGGIPILGPLLRVGRLFFTLKGVLNVLNDREEPLPYIGTIGGK